MMVLKMKILLVLGIFLAMIPSTQAQEPSQTLVLQGAFSLDEQVPGYYEALESSFSLAGNSQICPSSNCKYEFTEGILSKVGEGLYSLIGILNVMKDTGEKVPVHVFGDLAGNETLTGEISLDTSDTEVILEPDYLYKLSSGSFKPMEGNVSLDIKAERVVEP